MRKLIAIGLAGALATTSVGATTNSAQASGGGVIAGIAIGVGIVLLAHHWRYASTAYAGPYYGTYSYAPITSGHVQWCRNHYRSYNTATDSFTGYDGVQYRCVSPAY